jgi:RNA polymerase sigma-70 factor (ECF subfamily)
MRAPEHGTHADAATVELDFDALFVEWYPRLVARLASAGGDLHEASDAVQDAFVQAYERWQSVGAYERPEAWIQRVALHRLIDRRRKRDRTRSLIERLRIVPVAPPAEPSDVAAAVARLPPGQRVAVVLHYFDDLPLDAVARLCGISVGTVKSQLSDARQTLARAPEVRSE